MKFKECTEARYWEALGCLPPAVHRAGGFLLGEPETHRECTAGGGFRPAFAAFVERGGKFYESMGAMTPREFLRALEAELEVVA